MDHDDHLVMMTTHSYTPMLMAEGKEFQSMVTHLDPSIRPITRPKFTRTIIPEKLNKSETDVSSFLDGVCCVVIYYELWMSKTTQDIFNDVILHT